MYYETRQIQTVTSPHNLTPNISVSNVTELEQSTFGIKVSGKEGGEQTALLEGKLIQIHNTHT